MHGRRGQLTCLADLAAEGQARRSEVSAEADVERHVRVVRVHVEPPVLFGLVAHAERVVVVEARALDRPELAGNPPDLRLQGVERWAHADIVEDQAVAVHGIGPPRRQPTPAEVFYLVAEPVARLVVEERERVDVGASAMAPKQGQHVHSLRAYIACTRVRAHVCAASPASVLPTCATSERTSAPSSSACKSSVNSGCSSCLTRPGSKRAGSLRMC